jgi:hypothetical protein
MRKTDGPDQLKQTLTSLQEALGEWDNIPDDAECEMDAFKRKTREILRVLSDQIKELDL